MTGEITARDKSHPQLFSVVIVDVKDVVKGMSQREQDCFQFVFSQKMRNLRVLNQCQSERKSAKVTTSRQSVTSGMVQCAIFFNKDKKSFVTQ